MNSVVLAYPEVLPMYFIFFHSNNEFSHIVPFSLSSSSLDLHSDNDEVMIPFSFLISKIKSFPNHQLKDFFMFHIDVDADEFGTFQNMNSEHLIQQYLKVIPFLNDMTISPSLSLFHSLNALFFVLKEKPKSILPKLVFTESVSSVESLGEAPILHKTRKHYKEGKPRFPTRRETPHP